jgi:ferrochelatase
LAGSLNRRFEGKSSLVSFLQHAENATKYTARTPGRAASMNPAGRNGILLFNLGTPDAPRRREVARYLREFLSDPRVVDLPRWLWLPLLNFLIVPLRAGRSARAYSKVWSKDGSPLLTYSRALAEQMKATAAGSAVITLGMRYGRPSIRDALAELQASGVESLTVLPLYPQFSYTTTASGYDAVDAGLEALGWNPPQQRIRDYHDHPSWVQAVAARIREYWAENGRAELLLFSMHGIPQRYVTQGDPYQCHCEESAAAIVSDLGLATEEWQLTYQSRFGREPWLQPYTDKTLQALAGDGVRHVQVVCPGFAVDCLETLEEISMENRELFQAAGGKRLDYIPALNDSVGHASALLDIARGEGKVE